MFRGIWGKGSFVALLLGIGLLVTACGGGGTTTIAQAEAEQLEKHGREEAQETLKEARLEQKLAKLERENREAKKRRKEKAQREQKEKEAHVSPPAETTSPEVSPPEHSGTDCGDGVIAGPETSCGFALETRAEYEREIGAGPGSFEAYSEANEQFYPMYCTGAPHECTGAISATVYWP